MKTPDLFSLAAYDYELPQELIAQQPCTPRDHSRLMVVNRESGSIETMPFFELPKLLRAGDSLIFNDTKVIPARLHGRRGTGGQVEVLLLKELSQGIWEALTKPAKKLLVGTTITFSDMLSATVTALGQDGARTLQFHCSGDLDTCLQRQGQMPLPQYIQRDQHKLNNSQNTLDKERYQTIYAKNAGAAAAPTAGLHFTDQVLQDLSAKGVSQHYLTLHVGAGTFRPVVSKDIRGHQMHSEHVIVSNSVASAITASAATGRQICVGTTCCRSIESAASADGQVTGGEFDTDLFIYPGYQFKAARGLLTNFHWPKSSLLMLVSAFGGYDLIQEAYQQAIAEKFRFFSYGDAMLII